MARDRRHLPPLQPSARKSDTSSRVPIRRLARVTSRFVRSRPLLRRIGRQIWYYAPDFRTTINIEGLGPLRLWFGRHRDLVYRDFLTTHASHLDQFQRLIRPGDVVYDVGANIGYYARYIVRHCQPKVLIAFEPATENLDLLRDNVRLGQAEEMIKIFPIGLGDVDSEETLQIDDVYGGTSKLDRLAPGQASSGRRAFGLAPKTEQITLRRLDALVASGEIPPPDFIKIDVEGAETLVLSGAAATLRDHAPKLVIALHGTDVAREVIAQLTYADYVCYGSTFSDPRRDENTASSAKPPQTFARLAPDDAARLANMNIVASRDESDVSQLGQPAS